MSVKNIPSEGNHSGFDAKKEPESSKEEYLPKESEKTLAEEKAASSNQIMTSKEPELEKGKILKAATPRQTLTHQRGYESHLSAKSNTTARKLANFIIMETIFTLLLLGVCGFMLWRMYKMRGDLKNLVTKNAQFQAEINRLSGELAEANSRNSELEEDNRRIIRQNSDLKIERDTLKTELHNYEAKTKELEKNIASLQDSLSETEMKLREEKDLRVSLEDKNKELQNKLDILDFRYGELTQKYSSLEEKYQQIIDERRKQEEEKILKQKEFQTEYALYSPLATKMIEELKRIHSELETGLDFKGFVQSFDKLDINFKEFDLSLLEKHRQFLSYRLIREAYHLYEETKERWKNLIRRPESNQLVQLQDVVIKYELPITPTYRPWLDTIQILWYKASLLSTAAEGIVTAKETFNSTNCQICQGACKIKCPRCAGEGQCFQCNGKGFKNNNNSACLLCEATGRCPHCRGRKEISCPVCLMSIGLPSEESSIKK